MISEQTNPERTNSSNSLEFISYKDTVESDYPTDDQLISQLIKQYDEKDRQKKIVKDRLKCDLVVLNMRVNSPLTSRSVKKNIRAWIELKQQQLNTL